MMIIIIILAFSLQVSSWLWRKAPQNVWQGFTIDYQSHHQFLCKETMDKICFRLVH